jgi:ATP-dependent RNA helicase SUPV3L1/SUV3
MTRRSINPKRAIGKQAVADTLSILVKHVNQARAQGQLPAQCYPSVIAGLINDPPAWLIAAQAESGAAIKAQAQAAREHNERLARQAEAAKLAERQAEQQAEQQARPLTANQLAQSCSLSQRQASDLAIYLRSLRADNTLTQGDLAQVQALDEVARAELFALASEQAPAAREKVRRQKQERQTARRQAQLDRQNAGAQAREQRRALEERELARRQRQTSLREQYQIESTRSDPGKVRVLAAAALLGLSSAQVRGLVKKHHLRAETRRVSGPYGQMDQMTLDLDQLINAYTSAPEWLQAARRRAGAAAQREANEYRQHEEAPSWRLTPEARQSRQQQTDQAQWEIVAEAQRRISINLPSRRRDPETVTFHLGPTNSGKTHQALQALAANGSGVYAAPLRLLAREAHTRLSEQLGPDQVGLITGEERVNQTAAIICATAEMAPTSGQLLVLDEVQWAADPQRGSAWSRLLAGGEYRHIHIAGAPDAWPLVNQAFPEAELVVHQRLSPLSYIGRTRLSQLTPGTALVAFSRKAVLGLATKLRAQGRSVAVLYGAMPVQARQAELDRFATGQADILCTTDVIGHGINVPNLQCVCFAETDKYDGQQRRSLAAWEIAQIAGRAGRFGLTDNGHVQVLAKQAFFSPNSQLVEQALPATVKLHTDPDLFGHRRVERGILRPRLGDLHCDRPADLALYLGVWQQLARQRLHSSWLRIDNCADLISWHQQLPERALERLDIETVWQMLNIPADPDRHSQLVSDLTNCLLADNQRRSPITRRVNDDGARLGLEAAEERAAELSIIRWFAYAFPDRCPVTPEQAAEGEAVIAERVSSLIVAKLAHNDIGRCQRCGKACPPWFSQCDHCHQAQRSYYDNWDNHGW